MILHHYESLVSSIRLKHLAQTVVNPLSTDEEDISEGGVEHETLSSAIPSQGAIDGDTLVLSDDSWD